MAIAYYSITAVFGIEVLSANDDVVIWKWSNSKGAHMSKIRCMNGSSCFRANRMWVSLDECLSIRIAAS